MSAPLILFDPHPRTEEMVYTPDCAAALARLGRVEAHFGSRMPDARVEALLPEVALIIGQTAMDGDRLARAPRLRGIINVEANWRPNIDYGAAEARGVYVLSVAPCMAPAVAEFCLGQAIMLLRGLCRSDALFRAGTESYGIAGNRQARSLYGARAGLLGFGNLGRALVPLLRPFGCEIGVHDPYLSDGYLSAQGLCPLTLDSLLERSDLLFILAGTTTANRGFLTRDHLERLPHDASVILASRAEVVDFPTLLQMGATGRLRVAVDVFPEEPVARGDAIRATPNVVFSAHLAGGLHASYARIREAMLDDAAQILAGKPPMRLQRAEPALAAMSNSR